MTKYELKAIYGNQKSYYGKAYVVEDSRGARLYSYGTLVAEIVGNTFKYLWSGWSRTTANHVNEFAMQNGFPSMNKAQMVACRV